MFPGGMPDLTQIVLRAQQMQADMERAQASLAESEVTGSSGGGLVTATVTGSGELTGLTLAPEVVDPQDTETLVDLIIAAVRDANRRAQEMSSETMGAVTGGLAESFDLSSLGLGGFGVPGGTDQLAGDGPDDEDDEADVVLDGELVVAEDDVVEAGDSPAMVAAEDGIVEAEIVESGHPTDAGGGVDPAGPADRAAPGRS